MALAGLTAAGCADIARVTSLGPAPLDRTSPVAAQVEAASRKSYRTPSFRDAPPAPTDVRMAEAYKPLVAENVQARDRLTAYVAANPPMVTGGPDTEAFAADQRARIPADQTAAPPQDSSAGTEDLAARLRALATPPPLQSR